MDSNHRGAFHPTVDMAKSQRLDWGDRDRGTNQRDGGQLMEKKKGKERTNSKAKKKVARERAEDERADKNRIRQAKANA